MAQTEQALFKSGEYETKQITAAQAGGALTPGDVIVIGELTCVVHTIYTTDDYNDSRVAEVAVNGGLYSCLKGAGSMADGAKVYWDDSSNVVTTTASSNKVFGWTEEAVATGATEVLCRHNPAF